jgi:hypothetical protein
MKNVGKMRGIKKATMKCLVINVTRGVNLRSLKEIFQEDIVRMSMLPVTRYKGVECKISTSKAVGNSFFVSTEPNLLNNYIEMKAIQHLHLVDVRPGSL